MLRQVDALTKCSVRATDGAIGRVTDAYFDDQQWAVRYLVVDTGMWLGWHVLISPQSITALDWDGGTIDVALTRDQVERSPRADLQHPLSRLYESEFYTHFGYPPYWDAPPAWGVEPASPSIAADPTRATTRAVTTAEAPPGQPTVQSAADSHVRSWREVKGYHIHASDGEIGHVDDALFDERFVAHPVHRGGHEQLDWRHVGAGAALGARHGELARWHARGDAQPRAGEAQPARGRGPSDGSSGRTVGGVLRR